ncbi:hypothetical protein HUJ04_002412 [Dendroctonus ponderosae]
MIVLSAALWALVFGGVSLDVHVLASSDCSDCSMPVVKCQQGRMSGKMFKTREGRGIFGFLGIPFALPPVGDLRFKHPVPSGPWKGTLNASKIHPVCPQRDIYRRSELFEGEEDCLYLNVYSPKLPTEEDASLLPVMVFFHGGGWLCGGGNTMWYGPDVLLDRDVVLVVPNYRLGALGFLSTGDEIVPGNNGLKDQNLALRWIQSNIQYFGGDPKSVTLFGESAGGASVHYHMMSPKSKGVCHADDLQYLFPVGDGLFPDKKPSEDDKNVAKLFSMLFANFALTGNPTPEVSEVIPEPWKPVASDNMEFYSINAESPGMKTGLFLDRAKFWRTLESNPRAPHQSPIKDEL